MQNIATKHAVQEKLQVSATLRLVQNMNCKAAQVCVGGPK